MAKREMDFTKEAEQKMLSLTSCRLSERMLEVACDESMVQRIKPVLV